MSSLETQRLDSMDSTSNISYASSHDSDLKTILMLFMKKKNSN